MAKFVTRLRVRAVHRWIAYTLGALFALQGVTGALMAYRTPLDAWLNPHIAAQVSAFQRQGGVEPSLIDALDKFALEHPGQPGLGIVRRDDDGGDFMAFWPVADPVVAGEITFYLSRLHPQTGDSIWVRPYGSLPLSRAEVVPFLFALHTNLTIGAIGRFVLFGAAIVMCLAMLMGIYLWWPTRSGRILHALSPARVRRTALSWSLHRWLGGVSSSLLLLLAATGAIMQFSLSLDPGFQMRASGPGDVGARAIWRTAIEQYPDARTELVMGPLAPGLVYRVDLAPQSGPMRGDVVELFIDPPTGKIIRQRFEGNMSHFERALSWLEPLHGGEILGASGQALAALLGLVPVTLLISGIAARRRRAGLANQS